MSKLLLTGSSRSSAVHGLSTAANVERRMFSLSSLDISVPIIQAPMAGVSTPAMAAAVSEAGGLGSIAVGAADASSARKSIEEVQKRTTRAFNVNLFVHAEPQADPARESAWIAALAPTFAQFGAPPTSLRSPYRSFANDPEMLAVLLETRPPVISFHFGLPPLNVISALKETGALLLATVTSLDEACRAEAAGIDALVAQGIEAGGHRGVFDPAAQDDALSTVALTRLLVRKVQLPVIAAGGIMDGAGVHAALAIGAVAAQLGTAFVASAESAAPEAYRAALAGPAAYHTTMTRIISGRPARALPNHFTALEKSNGCEGVPDYPIAYDAGKLLHAAASAAGDHGFGAFWAGQGAPLARPLPAAELVSVLMRECKATQP